MNYRIRGVGVLLALGLAAGAARADLVSYTFNGVTDTLTGTPVLGSFSYQTDAPVSSMVPGLGTLFNDVGGSLTITALGHTYTSTLVGADLVHSGLRLSGATPGDPHHLVIFLKSPNFARIFFEVSTLPPVLNPNALGASTFGVSLHAGGPLGADPIIADGSITLLSPATVASETPEPGGILPAVVGAAVLAVRRGRTRGPLGQTRRRWAKTSA